MSDSKNPYKDAEAFVSSANAPGKIKLYNKNYARVGDRVWNFHDRIWCEVTEIVSSDECVVRRDDHVTETVPGTKLSPNPQA